MLHVNIGPTQEINIFISLGTTIYVQRSKTISLHNVPGCRVSMLPRLLVED